MRVTPEGKEYQRLATIKNGRIIMIGENFPPHKLKPNQFELTEKEFKLLYVNSNLSEVEELVKAIREKMKNLEE